MALVASSYPFLNIFWTILIFMAWVVWIWIAITVFIDLFRRRDMSGWFKAFWVIFVIVLPFLGVLVYLIAYHDSMAERSENQAQAQQKQFDNTCARPPVRVAAVPRPRSRRRRSSSTTARSPRPSSTR